MSSRIRKFLSYYRPHWRLLIADVACALVVAAITLVLPLGARAITQAVFTEQPGALRVVFGVGAGMLALLAVQTLCSIFVDYQGHMMGARMEADMRAELFAHYQALPVAFHDQQRTGQLMARITSDLFHVSELFHHGPEDAVIALLKFAGAFAILLLIDVPLALITFAFVPLLALHAALFYPRMVAATTRSREAIGDINAQVEDTLGGIRVVKSFTREATEAAKFAQANHAFLESRRRGYLSEAYFSAGMGTLTQLMTLAVVVFGAAASVWTQTTSAADLVTFLLFVAVLTDPVGRAVNITRLLQEGLSGYNRFLDMLAVQPTLQDAPDAIELADVRGEVRFDRVSFRYQPGQPDVLRDVSLTIYPGEYVALVGASGVGKSTLAALVPRFYDVTAGAVRVDGHDVRHVTQASLRRHIGVVAQDVYLFSGTVRDNIAYGHPDATDAMITAAAVRANAHDFIMALPDGYHTDVGQRGVKLSGGQKQRLSIARVFLKDPPILLFDEATSALDNESEQAVQRALEQLAHQRTLIVIAHRLTTIQNAARIIVLADGQVAEQGTHADLLTHGGVYAALHAVHARV